MSIQLLLLVLCCSACHTVSILGNKKMDKQLENAGQIPHGENTSDHDVEILRIVEITLSLLDGIFTITDAIEERILPQPKTEEDILDGVKRLRDLIRLDMQSQYKNVEDGVMRALIDMRVMEEDVTSSELKTLLWLERARFLNSNIVLLMDALLGRPVIASDLLHNIQQNAKCDVVKIWDKMERYNDLISNGSMAVNHFSRLGQMSTLYELNYHFQSLPKLFTPIREVNRRTAAVKDRNVKIVDRNIQLINNCFKRQLNETWNGTSTQQVANQISTILFKLYPSIGWIVAVHTNQTSHFKPKHSADYAFHLNGFNIALFPFTKGQIPTVIDGRAVDDFCRQPIKETGGMLTCNFASDDGEFIYNELRHRAIVPAYAQLIVVPSIGRLSITSTPPGRLPPFFAKRYSHFDIVAF